MQSSPKQAHTRRWQQLLYAQTGLSLMLLILCFGYLSGNPAGFIKAVSIQEGAAPSQIQASASPPDILALIAQIPYQPEPKTIYPVHPSRHYQRTVQQGMGNCANQSRGLAYWLSQHGHDYQLIHILPHEKFLSGWGHTLLRTVHQISNETHTGLIDIFEAGIPMSDEQFLDVSDLKQGPIADFGILRVSVRRPVDPGPYQELLKSASIGYTPAHELERYFQFVESLYVPLGHEKMEKMAYDTLAILTGFYPNIYVDSLPETFQGVSTQRNIYLVCLWLIRICLLSVAIGLLLTLFLAGYPRWPNRGFKTAEKTNG